MAPKGSKDLEAQRAYVDQVKGSRDLREQRAYAEEVLSREDFDFNLVVADAFVRGMRDIGYKSSAWALCELVDNSIQAEALNVYVIFDNEKQPTRVAIVDDGHGMDPEMIRLAVMWGGGHHSQSKQGFGKYGYGLPSASVAIGRRFTVVSKTYEGEWHAVPIDVDDIQEGKLTKGHRITVPDARPVDVPDWILDGLENLGRTELSSGNVVILDKLDRLNPKKTAGLQNALMEHFGVIYRNFLQKVNLFVNGARVEPVDPLFLTPGFRYFDLEDDHDRAVELEPLAFSVKDRDTGEELGTVRVRYSSMPPTFARVPEAKPFPKSRKQNERFPILDENNGLIICREGRQIDVIRSKRGRFSVNNDDRYWGVEIDFPRTLDEEFSITTSKQQVIMSDRIWDLLEKHGVFSAITELRNRYDNQKADLQVKAAESGDARLAENAMAQTQPYKARQPEGDTAKRDEQAQQEFEREARRRSEIFGVPQPEAERQLETQQKGREFITELESLPGAPFYRAAQRGGSKVLWINKAHRFYTKVYAETEDPHVRAAFELLLWILAEAEIDSSDQRHEFYQQERNEWSRRLDVALKYLGESDGVTSPLSDLADAARSGNASDKATSGGSAA